MTKRKSYKERYTLESKAAYKLLKLIYFNKTVLYQREIVRLIGAKSNSAVAELICPLLKCGIVTVKNEGGKKFYSVNEQKLKSFLHGEPTFSYKNLIEERYSNLVKENERLKQQIKKLIKKEVKN